jgi:gas vesicle protein
MKTANVILGLAAAAAVGAAIGMLIAPEKGSDLQRKMKDEANKWIDEVKKFVNNSRDLARNTEADMDEELQNIKSNLKPIED